jgi:hypothetical protein
MGRISASETGCRIDMLARYQPTGRTRESMHRKNELRRKKVRTESRTCPHGIIIHSYGFVPCALGRFIVNLGVLTLSGQVALPAAGWRPQASKAKGRHRARAVLHHHSGMYRHTFPRSSLPRTHSIVSS